MRFRRMIEIGAILLAALSIAPAQANLLTNGSFENGNLSGWTSVFVGSNSTATLVVSSPPYYETYDGNWQVALHTSRGTFGSNLYQDIATTIGDIYEVTFALRPGNSLGATFSVALDGTSLQTWTPTDSVFNPSTNPPVKDYQPLSLFFTATGTISRVGFYWVDNQTDWYLDNAAVTRVAATVPEPSSMLMMLSGFIGMIAVSSRRRSRIGSS